MRRFIFFALVVGVVVAPFFWAQEQEGTPRPRRAPRVFAGCPEAPAQFDPCATEKAKAFTPPRTPEGDPNLGGYWGRTMTSYYLEAHPDSFMIRGQPSMIVHPADGTLHYQP